MGAESRGKFKGQEKEFQSALSSSYTERKAMRKGNQVLIGELLEQPVMAGPCHSTTKMQRG